MIRWLHALWNWLAEGKVIFMGLLVVVVTLLLGMVMWQSEASIRISGFALQFLGMVLAARGLLQVRTYFGQTLLRNLFIEWLKRFPRWKGRTVNPDAASISARTTMSANVTVWASDNPKHSLEQRIQAIIKNLDHLRSAQSQQQKALEELKGCHEKHRKEIAENTKRLEENLRTDLESLHTADILTSLVGLGWITLGIFLSTVAPELYDWLGSA